MSISYTWKVTELKTRDIENKPSSFVQTIPGTKDDIVLGAPILSAAERNEQTQQV